MDRDGICPGCKEWTTAGESCCGLGAIVEGSLVTDEEAMESIADNTLVEFGGSKIEGDVPTRALSLKEKK